MSANSRPNKVGVLTVAGKEVPVLLRDISQDGARFRPLNGFNVPDQFRLTVSMDKIEVDCIVVWRRGHDVGVKFGRSD